MTGETRYSDGVATSFVALMFLGVFIFSIPTDANTGKTVFVAVSLTFLSVFFITRPLVSGALDIGRQVTSVAISIAPFAVVCAVSDNPAKQLAYLALVLFIVAFGIHARLGQSFWRWSAGILLTASLIHLLAYPAFGMPKIYQSFFAQKNVFALNMLMLFFCAFLCIRMSAEKDTKIVAYLAMAISVLMMLASHSRGVFIDVAFFLATWTAWQFIASNRIVYWMAFAAVLGGAVAFVPAYVLFSFTDLGQYANEIFKAYTGVNLFSGRNVIWPAYLYLISLKPVLGYGFGSGVANMTLTLGLPPEYVGLSAHNLYIMVAAETGIIGLAALLFFFASIWFLLFAERMSEVGAIACAVFLTGLLNDLFEVTLTQTNIDVIAFFWFIVALGLRGQKTA